MTPAIPELNFDGWTVEQKLALIDKLWDSIPPQEVPIPEWHRREIERRLADRAANPGASIPMEEVFARLGRKS